MPTITKNKTQTGKAATPPIEPHAELRDQQGALLAGIVRRDGEWVLGMGGKIAGYSESAARVLMLIRRAQRLHDEKGIPVKLVYSAVLREEAEREAAAHGKALPDYEQQMEEEMAAAQSTAKGDVPGAAL